MTTTHFDIVGSFLRPAQLKQARTQHQAGSFSREELTTVENQAIADLVAKEVQVGLKTVTDGEFRRSYWHLDTFWGFDGIKHTHQAHGYQFHGVETRNDSAQVDGKINFNPQHPDLQAFRYLQSVVQQYPGITARQSIPAPAQLYAELVRGPENSAAVAKYYPNHQDLVHDIGTAYRDLLLALYDAGCRDVKLDDCTWGMLADHDFWKLMTDQAEDIEQLQQEYVAFNNAALENLPADLRTSTHVCRGNYASTWAAQGGYQPVAKTLFTKENVPNYYLEFDDDRSGDFQPLAEVPDNKNVVLGLVTSKRPELEDQETLQARVKEASQYVDLDRLGLSTQCGFASTEEGNHLTEAQQWDKIKLVIQTANQIWPDQQED
ncbi:5-methyltetrahydropteroyltriglutamate--homocysteine S-methyltransferase [Fructilactobacillus myrtifloralis]|uniref:5-methyltetrahydropteroyltriglutamate--homocysteine S-methyltransferase n=1 Tax=Fructilactobacillus myrtifloralis TaxID=2940301 RepID=A0ABY5BPG6_9LACO|nr:5-methyltetrahydropteroyltriglutamate--homocysteine S-methyltransferase [Fructilactobacillus myrtifloralis]USS85573.1 5-methyltetrahydropteroyltriglutamate--homocysteine S-methyltransferase [Fructilactobacillus myrtifloralis]